MSNRRLIILIASIFLVVFVPGLYLAWHAAQTAQTDGRVVACAGADFNGTLLSYFELAERRTQSRIGTKAELPTDKEALAATEDLLAVTRSYAKAVNPICGRVIPVAAGLDHRFK